MEYSSQFSSYFKMTFTFNFILFSFRSNNFNKSIMATYTTNMVYKSQLAASSDQHQGFEEKFKITTLLNVFVGVSDGARIPGTSGSCNSCVDGRMALVAAWWYTVEVTTAVWSWRFYYIHVFIKLWCGYAGVTLGQICRFCYQIWDRTTH